MEQWAGALIQLGVAGVGLYLFVKGVLLAKPFVDQLLAALAAGHAAEVLQLEKRIAEGDERYSEMRTDRNAWKQLALQTEQRLDKATPVVATAIGAPVPSVEVQA